MQLVDHPIYANTPLFNTQTINDKTYFDIHPDIMRLALEKELDELKLLLLELIQEFKLAEEEVKIFDCQLRFRLSKLPIDQLSKFIGNHVSSLAEIHGHCVQLNQYLVRIPIELEMTNKLLQDLAESSHHKETNQMTLKARLKLSNHHQVISSPDSNGICYNYLTERSVELGLMQAEVKKELKSQQEAFKLKDSEIEIMQGVLDHVKTNAEKENSSLGPK